MCSEARTVDASEHAGWPGHQAEERACALALGLLSCSCTRACVFVLLGGMQAVEGPGATIKAWYANIYPLIYLYIRTTPFQVK